MENNFTVTNPSYIWFEAYKEVSCRPKLDYEDFFYIYFRYWREYAENKIFIEAYELLQDYHRYALDQMLVHEVEDEEVKKILEEQYNNCLVFCKTLSQERNFSNFVNTVKTSDITFSKPIDEV